LAALTEAWEIRDTERMSPTKVTEAYLRGLWAHVLRQAEIILHKSQEQLRESTIHAVVGVPADWSRDTIETLREAFEIAGIPGNSGNSQFPSTLNFMPEPEAAILSLLRDRVLSKKLKVCPPPPSNSPAWPRVTGSNPQLTNRSQNGDAIVVCDSGGGTSVSFLFLISPFFAPSSADPQPRRPRTQSHTRFHR
jgi:molecular chaperone DnaK (HSP70)